MLYPLTFHPAFKERVWGGRALAGLFGKSLPPGVPIGESWEISDRPGDASVIDNGPLAGRDLRWLMLHHRVDVMGANPSDRFPLLAKILDARESLSLQVHPPAQIAGRLGGEPKTEIWYVAQAGPGAALFVGLRRGATRAEFERRIGDGTVAECFHRVLVQPGDVMFLPSGRVHALGAGLVIFEIQQNSDTTYRVFDWNRPGLDGKPRPLHIEQSLASIDFEDFEPSAIRTQTLPGRAAGAELVGPGQPFRIVYREMAAGEAARWDETGPWILAVVRGSLSIEAAGVAIHLPAGQFCLLPASLGVARFEAAPDTGFLLARPN